MSEEKKQKYAGGRIYKLTSPSTQDIYIGGTTQSLRHRLYGHYGNYKAFLKSQKKYVTSYEIIKWGDPAIELIEDYPCDSKRELLIRERYYIENTPNCINAVHPTRTITEWRIDNKDRLAVKAAAYYDKNIDRLRLYKRTKVPCDVCAKPISSANIAAHCKRMHQRAINSDQLISVV